MPQKRNKSTPTRWFPASALGEVWGWFPCRPSFQTYHLGGPWWKKEPNLTYPSHAEMSARNNCFWEKNTMADLLFFLEPGFLTWICWFPNTKRSNNWVNSDPKFLHTLHQTKTCVSFYPGGFAWSNMWKFASTSSTWNTMKKLIVLDPRLPFMRKSNDLFFFVGLVGEIQIVKSSSERLEKQQVI